MGHIVDFQWPYYKYAEHDLGVGRGKSAFPFLALFRCDSCKTIGSTWVRENQIPRCSNCYHDAVIVLPDDATRVGCPRRGEVARITRKEGAWE